MEEDVWSALQTRTAYIPGGFDRDGKVIIVVNVLNDLQLWNKLSLELSIKYLKRALSPTILLKGVTVIVDAQKCTRRITRAHARTIFSLFNDLSVNLYLVRAEGFWEKHVETCTRLQTTNETLVLPMSRLSKYFDLNSLPVELGGLLNFHYDLWLQQRKSIDEFQKSYEKTLAAMDNLHGFLLSNKSLHPSDADVEVKNCAQRHATVQRNIDETIEMGNRILQRLCEAYLMPIQSTTTTSTIATTTMPTCSSSQPHSHSNSNSNSNLHSQSPSQSQSQSLKAVLPPDLICERSRIELRMNVIERKQTEIRTAWLELLRSLREIRELATIQEGVSFVTNWILNTADELLSRQHLVGGDVCTCETLRSTHDALEMDCRGTYGIYAELLYKIDSFKGSKDSSTFRDLISQRDFMNFVCRSFAQRLERRRNVLITSLRFFRLVTEYFERTTAVFETLVIGNGLDDNLDSTTKHLRELKENQTELAQIEREVIKEGEKLSDMLSMPVKDALGRDLNIDYSSDIRNVREILDTTIARRNLFVDSVELQKLTLEQVTHIQAYEQDARMAIQWMIDLYNVMIKYHSHVGCSIHEIQVQKDELQVFQETGKSIFDYGFQLLEASRALRLSCKLNESKAGELLDQLNHPWYSLQAISQENMTRLRVSAVFHRSVEEYCQQMLSLEISVRNLWNLESPLLVPLQYNTERQMNFIHTTGSSSGISSVSDASSFQTHTETTTLYAPHFHPEAEGEVETKEDFRRDQLQKYLSQRENLLVEVGRMVRLGRLLKTRLREPFILDAATGKSIVAEEVSLEIFTPDDVSTSSIPYEDSNNIMKGDELKRISSPDTVTVNKPSTIVVHPIGHNNIACEAITQKLNDIAEIAGSLDAAIREVQNGGTDAIDALDTNSSTTSSEKKPNPSCSGNSSGEDWHSRSTEDDSFATASEGNFTPHSHSSSFQTASGHTSTSFFLSSLDKNSLDASEEDDSTLTTFDIAELHITSPNNASFDSSDRSFLSAKQDTLSSISPQTETEIRTPTSNTTETNGDQAIIRSQSVTPTPDNCHHFQSSPVYESYIADAPTLELLTEETPPEPLTSLATGAVGTCSDSICGNKANASWRRSKYYENITKQTIKGFL